MISVNRQTIIGILNQAVFAIGFLSVFIFILRIGFYLSDTWNFYIVNAIQVIVIIFCTQELIRWFTATKLLEHLKNRWFENFVVVTLAFYFIQTELIFHSVRKIHPNLGIDDVTIAYLGITQMAVAMGEMVRYFRGTNFFSKLSLTTAQIFSISFAVPILIGTCLLKLPKATVDGITWLDAFFTATSSVCVTGLTVLNTAEGFTPLGQFIICLLFQMGGLGIMTLSLAVTLLFSGGLGLKERILMSDIFSDDRMGEIGGILAKITAFTFTIEAVGAVLLYITKGYDFTAFQIQEFYYAIFHAISAFCNAGFSLYSDGLADPSVATNVSFGSVIMLLIFLGGIGFPVLLNIYEFLNPKKSNNFIVKIPTRLILISTAFLVFGGTIALFLSEGWQSYKGLEWWDKLYHAAFLSISSRTAGLNIWPTENFSIVTSLIIILLMWIGGSPMSTAGGIKNLTFTVAILSFKAIIKGKNSIEVFGREIYQSSIFKAFNIIFVSIIILFTSTLALIVLEPLAAPFDLLFEAVSAYSTVGLTRGVTSNLSEPSKLILIGLMYTGRIGFITVLGSFFLEVKKKNYKYLKENIPIN